MKIYKNTISIILAICIIASVYVAVPFSGAQALTSGIWSYEVLDDGTIRITDCSNDPADLVIPTEIDGYKVTELGDRAFYKENGIESVTIPEGISCIRDYCFYDCRNLRRLEFKTTGYIYLCYDSFNECELTEIIFPKKGMLQLGNHALNDINMDTLVLPETVVGLEWYIFSQSTVKDVYILNPECFFAAASLSDDGSNIFPRNTVIHADEVSTAHIYADNYSKSMGYTFEVYDTHNNRTETIHKKATTKSDGHYTSTCDYCGESKEYTVKKIKTVSLSAASYTYSGKQKTPKVKAVDSAGKTISSKYYTVTYPKGRVKAGKYTVTVTFKDHYSGTMKKSFTIAKKRLKAADIKIPNIIYKGKATTPKIRHKGKTLKAGRDYTVTKINKNKSIGTANITVKLQGNYSGTVKTSYKILPDKVTDIKFKKRSEKTVTFKWKKVKGVTGYKVYRYNHNTYKFEPYKTTRSTSMTVTKLTKGLSRDYGYVIITVKAYKKVGKKFYYGKESENYGNCVKPRQPTYKVTCPDFGNIRILYKNLEYALTYVQIQVCINKSFNNREYNVRNMFVTIDRASDYDRYDFSSGLIRDERYYVRCRQYLYSDGMNPVYSKWGKKKKIYVR